MIEFPRKFAHLKLFLIGRRETAASRDLMDTDERL